MKSCVGICMALMVLSCPALAQESVHVYGGYLKGQSYLELSDASRMAYAIGIVDGLFSSGFYGANPDSIQKLQQCTNGMNSRQLTDVLDQYVRTHQARWQDPMNVLATNALIAACPVMRAGFDN